MNTDALGNELKLHEYYGYSRRSNGVVTVIVGVLVKKNEKSVQLKVLKKGSAIYQNDIKEENVIHGEVVNVSPNSIFKLESKETKW
jgi:hypothetical protein